MKWSPVFNGGSETDQPEYAGETTYVIDEGSRDYRIELMLDSSPVPVDSNFFWFFNDLPLVDGQNGVVLGVNFIQFRSVSRVNAGSYRVMSSNSAGSGGFNFELRVNCTCSYFLLQLLQNMFSCSCSGSTVL